MKTSRCIVSIFILVLFALCFATISSAVLVDNGDGTITDTDTNLMWIQDANYTMTSGYDADGVMNWFDALAWAENLDYAGFVDWRLPTTPGVGEPGYCTEFNCTESEMGHLYYTVLGNSAGSPMVNFGSFTNIQSTGGDSYWFNKEFRTPSNVMTFFFNGGWVGIEDCCDQENYAWAVRDMSVVPEPISSILFITGGTLLACRSYIKRKKTA